MALTPDNEVPLPENIQAYVNTMLAWDDSEKLEETLSGAATRHWVNGRAVQARHFGPNLHPSPGIEQARSRKRSTVPSEISAVPPYNAGDRCGPRTRKIVEVTAEEILAEARKKTLLWNLVRLHAEEKQEASGWTGFNISVRSKVQVSQDVIGYLPTIDAPATDMATVQEVLVQSLKIKSTFKLKSIVLVFDQRQFPPEWYRNVVFGSPGPWTNGFNLKEVQEERFLNFLEANCSSFNRDVVFSVTMASRFEKADEEYIEEWKAKGENEDTKNSTEWWKMF